MQRLSEMQYWGLVCHLGTIPNADCLKALLAERVRVYTTVEHAYNVVQWKYFVYIIIVIRYNHESPLVHIFGSCVRYIRAFVRYNLVFAKMSMSRPNL